MEDFVELIDEETGFETLKETKFLLPQSEIIERSEVKVLQHRFLISAVPVGLDVCQMMWSNAEWCHQHRNG